MLRSLCTVTRGSLRRQWLTPHASLATAASAASTAAAKNPLVFTELVKKQRSRTVQPPPLRTQKEVDNFFVERAKLQEKRRANPPPARPVLELKKAKSKVSSAPQFTARFRRYGLSVCLLEDCASRPHALRLTH